MGVRGTKAAPVEGEHPLYAFLTTDANAVVAPVHPKAMPVILRTVEEIDRWLPRRCRRRWSFSARVAALGSAPRLMPPCQRSVRFC
jgi:putative SOS response-associated peptidase YedK